MIPPPLWPGAVGADEFYYVYILRSRKTDQLYLGFTGELRRRLCQHNAGESRATRGRGPYELIYFEAYRHREEALAREQNLKKRPNAYRYVQRRLYRTLARASSRAKEVVG